MPWSFSLQIAPSSVLLNCYQYEGPVFLVKHLQNEIFTTDSTFFSSVKLLPTMVLCFLWNYKTIFFTIFTTDSTFSLQFCWTVINEGPVFLVKHLQNELFHQRYHLLQFCLSVIIEGSVFLVKHLQNEIFTTDSTFFCSV